MLLSRFWYVFLAVTTAVAAGAAMLAQSVINTRIDEGLEESLRRDRLQVEAFLRLDARDRLDRIAFITVDNRMGNLLRAAGGTSDDKRLREINGDLKKVMREQVTRIVDAAPKGTDAKTVEPDIAFALDKSGRIIAQLGPLEANPPGSSLATYPLVRRVLQGYVRDDVWVYDRRVYRMAGRPVMAGASYAGAILHGYRFEKPFAHKLSTSLGPTSVAFFYGTSLLAEHVSGDEAGVPQSAELVPILGKLASDQRYAKGERSDVYELQGGGRAVFSLVTGAASDSGVGYAIARPRAVLTSPEQLFERASQNEVSSLPMPLLGGGAALLAALGLFFIWVERDRHLKMLTRKTADIAAGERDRLIVTEWRGAYRKLADAVNQAIDKSVDKAADMAPTAKKKANLDEILGPTPESKNEPFFGFADDAKLDDAVAPSPPPAAAPSPLPTPPKPAPPAPAAARAPSRPGSAAPSLPGSAPAASPSNGADFDEDAHWRDVYEQYVAARKQCGEPVANVTFEKFGVTLKKTRDQIMSKQNVRAVRFTVQVKQGKAALKAQPIKK